MILLIGVVEVYCWCMVCINIDIDDDFVCEVMWCYDFFLKKEVVDFVLCCLVGVLFIWDFLWGFCGLGWSGDFDVMCDDLLVLWGCE